MIEEFKEAFSNRYQVALERKEDGQKVAGWACNYVPEEIIYAGGMLPFRVLGGAGETSKAEAYLYSNSCSYALSCLEEALENQYDFLDGIILSNTCDPIRRLYDVWNKYVGTCFTNIINVPHKISDSSLEFLKREFVRLKKGLEESFKIELPEEAISQAIKVYNKTRSLLHQLYSLRMKDSPPISGAETLDVVLAGMILPRDRFNSMLENLLMNIGQRDGFSEYNARILISGSELDNSDYIKVIEEAGGLVVADDLCIGSRYFWDLVDTDGDPIEALARRYLTHTPCPRMYPSDNRIEHLKKMVETFKVDGIIRQRLKFCDLYGIDLPLVKDGLRDLGTPILSLEREYGTAGTGQMKTRVQAFLESIGG